MAELTVRSTEHTARNMHLWVHKLLVLVIFAPNGALGGVIGNKPDAVLSTYRHSAPDLLQTTEYVRSSTEVDSRRQQSGTK